MISPVDIAVRSPNGAHAVSNLHWRCIDSQVNLIVQCRIPAGRAIQNGHRLRYSISSLLRILILPRPPRPINHRMMKEEPGIPGRGEKVSARVATDGVVATGMRTEELVLEEAALEEKGEPVDVVVLCDEGRNLVIVGIARRDIYGDIAAETPWVVAEPGHIIRVRGDIVEGWDDGTEVDSKILKRAAGDAAATLSSREQDGWLRVTWDAHRVMVDV